MVSSNSLPTVREHSVPRKLLDRIFMFLSVLNMAEYEFANDPNVYFIYRNKKTLELDEPELILVLKNEYHDYYDQLN